MLNPEDMKKIYECRPFKTRNADEFDINSILNLFVDPTDGLISPFDFENTIIKGKMGTGKTMYLKANYAYYLSILVPYLLNNIKIVLPIYLRFSDLQHITDPTEIYRSIMIKLAREIVGVYRHLQNAKTLAKLHLGIQNSSFELAKPGTDIYPIISEIRNMSSEEYTNRTEKAISGEMGIVSDFIKLSAQCERKNITEIKRKPNPGIEDIITIYNTLLKPFNCNLLILIDEVGSLNKAFFKENGDSSMFETLMNQLRTTEFVRTKIAIYPQTYSDILPETRYGNPVMLQEDIKSERGYINFENRTMSLIEKYIKEFANIDCRIEDMFEIRNSDLNLLEQLINASDGNVRRFVYILDKAMNRSYQENEGNSKVNLSHVIFALKDHARELEQLFTESEVDFLNLLVGTCKARSTYKFRFPNKSIDVLRYVKKSSEYNIINLIEHGSGRKGAVYAFDYAYSVYKDIPTHYLKSSERIDKSRSKKTGEWITKITTINQNIIEHSKIPGKIEGDVDYITADRSGFIIGEDNNKYFFRQEEIIDSDKTKPIHIETRVRFLPYKIESSSSLFAYYVEIL